MLYKYDPVVQKTAVCDKCGDPTWSGAKTCVNCKRKSRNTTECGFPDCDDTFLKTGKQKYCIVHRSLDARRHDLKILVSKGKITQEFAFRYNRGASKRSEAVLQAEPIASEQLLRAAIKAGYSPSIPDGSSEEFITLMVIVAGYSNYLLWVEEEGLMEDLRRLAQ